MPGNNESDDELVEGAEDDAYSPSPNDRLTHESQHDHQTANNGNNSTSGNSADISSVQTITLKPSGSLLLADPRSGSPLQGKVYTATWCANMLTPHGVVLNLARAVKEGEKNIETGVTSKKRNHSHNNRPGGTFPGPPPPPRTPKSDLTFKECGGLEKQINYLKTAVLDLIRNQNLSGPENKFMRFGIEPPKGILFYGPPGTGKTRLAQALGNELTKTMGQNVNFIYRKGQDIASKYFGQSSANLREVFDEAIQQQPTVLFFDELDGLCPSRDRPYISQANVTIVTTMLGLMDELPRGKVFVIAATNRLEAVDPALRRPGRFDKYLEFLPPPEQGRLEILNIHTRKWKIQPGNDFLLRLSHQTAGFSGADLAKLCLDAFDNALSRCLSQNNNRSSHFSAVNLSSLLVEEKDWKVALRNMKPSNSALFGSMLYTPSQNLGCIMEPLTQLHVDEIQEKLMKLLPGNTEPANSAQDQNIRSCYVWSQTEYTTASIDGFIISQILRSHELGQYPIYCISPEVLCSSMVKNWPSKVNDAFTQAIGAGSAILYLQNIDEIWDLINDSRLGLALDLKQQLERLRGTSVVLLASGSTKLAELSQHNPFIEALAGAGDRSYEIKSPSDNEREKFFAPIFGGILMNGDREWPVADVNALTEVLEKAVACTAGKSIGSIALLYELIVQNVENGANENSEKVLKKLIDQVGLYKMKMI